MLPRPHRLFVLSCLAGLAACAGMGHKALDPRDMASSGDPGLDFYRFANGGWLDRHPVPPEYSSWGVFHEVNRRNEKVLRGILEEAARDQHAPRGSVRQQLGDFYASGMDVAQINAAGVAPLQPEFDRIASLASVDQLPGLLAHLHSIGAGAFFEAASESDFQDSNQIILYASEGGLGLPDRDYYFRDRDAETRRQYIVHVARMLELLGDPADIARTEAEAVMRLETALAEPSFTAVESRDPQNLARKVTVAEADAALPHFGWPAYLQAAGLGSVREHGMPNEKFWPVLDQLLADTPLEDIRAYLTWHLVHAFASSLSADFEEEDFDFYSRKLSGTEEMRPRWKRVLAAANRALGEALGQAFVEESFSPVAKRRAEEMVGNLLWAMRQRIESLPWMTPETRVQAEKKLAAFRYKIGYPDEWRDYSALEIDRGPYVLNILRARRFASEYDLGKVDKPRDENEWGMTPQMVNAYYHPFRNEIVFPAGILQPPFFNEKADDAVNYGAMGAVIGHEITHGFDDAGSQFDAAGNLRDWWTDTDRKEFEARTAVLARQFDQYEVLPGVNVNGRLTLGENIADLGGLTIAYMALQRALQGRPATLIGGFTPEQRFFLSWATAWRQNARDEYLRLLVSTNPHAPARFRALGPLSNLQEFADAFGLDASSPMVRPPAERAHIW